MKHACMFDNSGLERMLRAFLQVKRKALLFDHFSGANQRPSRGRSAGVTFCRQKVTKDRQRRGLPPPCGIHPAESTPRYGVSLRSPCFGP